MDGTAITRDSSTIWDLVPAWPIVQVHCISMTPWHGAYGPGAGVPKSIRRLVSFPGHNRAWSRGFRTLCLVGYLNIHQIIVIHAGAGVIRLCLNYGFIYRETQNSHGSSWPTRLTNNSQNAIIITI